MGTKLMNKINGTSIASGDDDVGAEISDACPGRHLLRKNKKEKNIYATPFCTLFFFFFFSSTTISKYQTHSVFVPTGQLCNDYVFVKETFFFCTLLSILLK